MRRSLSTHLLLWAVAMLVAGLVCVFGSWSLLAQARPHWLGDRDLMHMARRFAASISFDSDGRPSAAPLRSGLQPVLDALPSDVFYQVLDARGAVLLSSNRSTTALLPTGRQPGDVKGIYVASLGNVDLDATVLPLKHAGLDAWLLTARSHRFHETLLENDSSNERFAAIVASLASMAVFAAAVLITIRGLLRRLRRISTAAARIDPSNLRARLAVDDVPQELIPLIDSFNEALARLEAGFRIQQDFLATVAHELKTPLALVRGEIELDGPTNRHRILADLDHMGRQVNQLLHLAEVSDASALTRTPIDAVVAVRDAVDFVTRLAGLRNVQIRLSDSVGSSTIHADASALFVLVRNLVENAIHHAPDGSVVDVGIDASGFWVRDQGPGIRPEDLPLLFKRFWRGAHRRDTGAGLGLSICSEIVRGHGWVLSARNAPGAGAEFAVLVDAAPRIR
jgi:signal transduction histidine kinase